MDVGARRVRMRSTARVQGPAPTSLSGAQTWQLSRYYRRAAAQLTGLLQECVTTIVIDQE